MEKTNDLENKQRDLMIKITEILLDGCKELDNGLSKEFNILNTLVAITCCCCMGMVKQEGLDTIADNFAENMKITFKNNKGITQ